MNWVAVVFSLVVAGVAVAGCSKKAPTAAQDMPSSAAAPSGRGDDVGDPFVEASTSVPTAAAAPASPLTATMRLLDAGRPPRKKLRYAWRHDRKETLTIDLRTTAATEVEGERPAETPLPRVRIVVAIAPQSVTPEGDLLYAWHVTSTEVTPAAAANPQLADGMRAEVATISRLAGTASVTSRGLAQEVNVDATTVTDAGATGQMVEQVRQTLRDLAAPLPEEEVGPGGRWEKLSQLAARDAVVTQTETFSLASLGGSKGDVDDILAQTAPPQTLPTPGALGARPARLESMLATGASKTHFDLTRLVPTSSFDGTTTMVVSGEAPVNASKRMTMILRVTMTLSGTTP